MLLQQLRTPKTMSNENSLPFITTYNPNNQSFHETIEKSAECLKRKKIDGFKNLRVLKSKRQVGVFKCRDKRSECCTSLLLGNSYIFKNVDNTFNLKTHFTCHSCNLFYVAVCPTCSEEYTGETGIGKTKVRDCVQVY